MTQTLQLLNQLGVQYTNIRTFGSLNAKTTTVVTTTENPEQVIKKLERDDLLNGTINLTFNGISKEAVKKQSIVDADIEKRRLVLIDVDTKKPETDLSATDQEKNVTYEKLKKIETELILMGFHQPIVADSGNGYHMLLPVDMESTDETKQLIKSFLRSLSDSHSDESAEIDTSVYNSSRLTKLYGCIANKGKDTKERPHRLSKILSIPDDLTPNDQDIFQQYVEKKKTSLQKSGRVKKVEKVKVASQSLGKKTYVANVDVEKWLNHYSLEFEEKDGGYDGWRLFIFDSCPLKTHSNNQSGASISVSPTGIVKFKCLHQSHEKMMIHDFAERYLIPQDAWIKPTTTLIDNKGFCLENYQLDSEGLKRLGKDDDYQVISSSLFINKVFENVDLNHVDYEFACSVNNEWKRIPLTGDDFTSLNIKKLSRFGVDIFPNLEPAVLTFLQKQKKFAEWTRIHSYIGWHRYEGEENLVFNLQEGVRSNGRTTSLSLNVPYDLNSKGSYSEWSQKVKESILGTPMEMALIIGFCSIVLGYLSKNEWTPLPSLLISIYGKTTTGKTTTQRFIESLFGDPKTLLLNFNATQNALIKQLANNCGVPISFDESGANAQSDLTSFVYQLATGSERSRLNREAELKEVSHYNTVVTLSSEESLTAKLNTNDGLKVRYVEFADRQWTKDAEQAEIVDDLSNNYHAVGAERMLEKISMQSKTFIWDEFKKAKKDILAKLPDSSLKNRLAEIYSIFLTTSRMVTTLLDLHIDEEKLFEEILCLEQEVQYSICEDDPKEIITEMLVKNSSHFMDEKEPFYRGGAVYWGSIKIKKNDLILKMFKNTFENKLRSELKINDVRPVVKELRKDGYIVGESDRNTKRLKMLDCDGSGKMKKFPVYEIHLDKKLKKYFPFRDVAHSGPLTADEAIDPTLGI